MSTLTMVNIRDDCFKIARFTMTRLQPHRANVSGRNAALEYEGAQYLYKA